MAARKKKAVAAAKAVAADDEASALGLRRPDPSLGEGPRHMVSLRFPREAIAYWTAAARASGKPKTDIIVEAIYLDRDLHRRLEPSRQRLVLVAGSMGKSLEYDLAEVLASLIEIGLRTTIDPDPETPTARSDKV